MLSALRDASRTPFKAAFAAAVAAAAVFAFSAPAVADPVTGEYVGHKEGTQSTVKLKNRGSISTSLLKLEVDGSDDVLLTYCIDINTQVKKVGYSESDWSEANLGENAKYINWILHHSVPYLSTQELAQEAGLSETPSLKDAVAGTQAAIWHYSDGVELSDDNRKVVKEIYDYLTSDANAGLANQPAPTLALSPENISGEPGSVLGPIEVTTSAAQVEVSLVDAPEGAKLLGPDKQTEVTTAKNGDQLWVSIPADAEEGSAKVGAKVTSKVSPGRVFIAQVKSQKLILADSDEVTVKDQTNVSWAKQPTPAPGSSVATVCEPEAGVKVTLTNDGDAPAEFTVEYGDKTDKITVEPGEPMEAVIPVEEDATYKIVVKSGDYEQVYEGVLDCVKNSPQPTASPTGGGGGLPMTGMSGLTTILGVGAALLLAGIALLFVVRKRRTAEEA